MTEISVMKPNSAKDATHRSAQPVPPSGYGGSPLILSAGHTSIWLGTLGQPSGHVRLEEGCCYHGVNCQEVGTVSIQPSCSGFLCPSWLTHWVWSEGVGLMRQQFTLPFSSWFLDCWSLFIWCLRTVSSQVTGAPTLPAHRLPVPTAFGLSRLSSPRCHGCHLLQPCKWSDCCLYGFQFRSLA
jgi:hypothetical protein